MLVVNFHFHLLYEDGSLGWSAEKLPEYLEIENARSYWSRPITKEDMGHFLQENGVDYAVILPQPSLVAQELGINEKVGEICQGIPGLIPFASISPYAISRPSKKLKEYVAGLGFKGIVLHPADHQFYPNDGIVYPIYAQAEDLNIPVVIHTGVSESQGSRLKYGDPLFLDDVAVDFPHLTLVQAHRGWSFWNDRAFFLTRIHEHIYMEMGGLPLKNLLQHFPDLDRNAHKVILGSDWPGVSAKKNVEAVRQLTITDQARANILGGNAARILGLLPKQDIH